MLNFSYDRVKRVWQLKLRVELMLCLHHISGVELVHTLNGGREYGFPSTFNTMTWRSISLLHWLHCGHQSGRVTVFMGTFQVTLTLNTPTTTIVLTGWAGLEQWSSGAGSDFELSRPGIRIRSWNNCTMLLSPAAQPWLTLTVQDGQQDTLQPVVTTCSFDRDRLISE